ncbi:hypothetical protein HMPREF0908_0820 [Selenomonas flueggei ATCC 43531]|uniref:Uncharacterized protein n=1 Tax=Selenomonas flueggei ATCC 43531 TaxID=638302 RepID=C4V2V6_9FIRM|nr:hypothetical protein HMPREF0908_0820 [Selenomonas flueggei ATCC 43531]
MGRDRGNIIKYASRCGFNPRAPCGARLAALLHGVVQEGFQSTRPVWGATRKYVILRAPWKVSIHAPRVGRDSRSRSASSLPECFNPRAPCGARRRRADGCMRARRFNPRAPCGARHIEIDRTDKVVIVSIHAPRVGRDVDGTKFPNLVLMFQSTRPVWGATPTPSRPFHSDNVSIHAPRVGRDYTGIGRAALDGGFNPRAPCGARPKAALYRFVVTGFNPRAPCGARLPRIDVVAVGFDVSIHAPRVGRDHSESPMQSLVDRFNPRAPCGARLTNVMRAVIFDKFQSTRPVWGATVRPRVC